ncbi:MAG TPA: dockerin type I domain-containing protein [Phycisphaerae bacterium]|nr:dockerin type I domain-containing protein [Phycisphaerae bacterium]
MNTRTGCRLLAAAAFAATFLAWGTAAHAGDVVINEFWVQDCYSASAQYVELYNKSASTVSLSGYSVIAVDGDTFGYPLSYNYRWVTFRADLSGSITSHGYYVVGCGLTPNPDVSFTLGAMKTTGSQNFVLVRTSDIAFTADGVHLTAASAAAIAANPLTDAVFNWDGDTGDDNYFSAPVVTEYPSYYSAWSTASRMPDGGAWNNAYGQYNSTTPVCMELGSATDYLSTPGKANGKTGDSTYPRTTWGSNCAGSTCTYVAGGSRVWRDCSHPDNPCTTPTARNIQYVKNQGAGWGGRLGPVVLTCKTDLTSSGNSKSYTVQDLSGSPTRGMTIFGINTTMDAFFSGRSVGDSITIEGTSAEYYGLLQLEDNAYKPLTFTYNGAGTVPPVVTGYTCAQLNTAAVAEPLESVRVRIDCVSFITSNTTFTVGSSGTNYTITDGTDFYQIFIPYGVPLVGAAVPTVPKNVTGIINQHDFSAPYTSGYQLVMYDPNDITAATCATGRCCQPAGGTTACMVTSQAVCNQLCGTWTLGGTCPYTCPVVTTGACQLPSPGGCLDGKTKAQCDALGGQYLGSGSTCAHGACYVPRNLNEVRALEAGAGLVQLPDVVVTSTIDLINSANSKNFTVQDASGPGGAARGLTVFGNNADVDKILGGPDGDPNTLADNLVPGDHIDLSGMVIEYNSMLELGVPMGLNGFLHHGTIAAPTVVTVGDFQSDITAEPLESTLVELDCVTFVVYPASGNFEYSGSSTNLWVRHGANPPDVNVRVSTTALDLVGKPVPLMPVNLIGIMGQNGNLYQLLLRSLADIKYECPDACYGPLDPNTGIPTAGLPGDFDRDGQVDVGDIEPFVDSLLGTGPSACGDVNQDGKINGLDIQAFISKLMHEGPAGTIDIVPCNDTTCPAPGTSDKQFCNYYVMWNDQTRALLAGLTTCESGGAPADGDYVCIKCPTLNADCEANNGTITVDGVTYDVQVFRWLGGLAGEDCYFVGAKLADQPTCWQWSAASCNLRFMRP